MNNEIMKYEGNFFGRIINKIKLFFFKNKVAEKEIIKEEIKVEHLINNDESKQKFVELVIKFNAREIEEKDLSAEEKEQLTKYYEDKNKELDKQIEDKKKILKNINSKINRYYEKTMKLKAE